MAELSSFNAIQSNLFVKIEVEYYKSSPSATPISTNLTFSDARQSWNINGDVYQGLGKLLSITGTVSEIRPSSGDLTIAITGIPNTSIYEIVNSRIKGCPVTVYRLLTDPVIGNLLDVDNPLLRKYRGFVNNYSLTEEYDINTRTSSNTIGLICSSAVDVLQNKYTGRRTNPVSEKSFFPNDLSMDRVPNLENATFNFGAPL